MRRVVCSEIEVSVLVAHIRKQGLSCPLVATSIIASVLRVALMSFNEKQSLVSSQTKSSSQTKGNKSKEICCTVLSPVLLQTCVY